MIKNPYLTYKNNYTLDRRSNNKNKFWKSLLMQQNINKYELNKLNKLNIKFKDLCN